MIAITNHLHKSHKALDKYSIVHHSITKMCTYVHISDKNGALWDICLMLWRLCETGLLWSDGKACFIFSLRWRHNERDSVSNHQPHGCLHNGLLRRRSKKTSKLRVTGLCVGNSPGPVNSPHKGPVTRKMFPFNDVIMSKCSYIASSCWEE